MVAQALNETYATIVKIMLASVGAASFCLLSLFAPDSSLLTGGVTLNVPFAGPVSFLGFMIIGPLVLIALRIYLQIYIEFMRRLERICQRLHPVRVPILLIRRNVLLRGFTGFVLYLLLPLTMIAFTWKAAVLVAWIPALVGATTAVIVSHVILPLRWPWRSKLSLQSKILLGLGVVIIPAGAILAILTRFGGEPLQRPYHLFRADLSGQWLRGQDLKGADLWGANLGGADLVGADLENADLEGANLVAAHLEYASLEGANLVAADLGGAHLEYANLWGAHLKYASLEGANLGGADLGGAHLEYANLGGAHLANADLSKTTGTTQTQLDKACGTNAKPPGGLTISPCKQAGP
jgi:hypothetical protein